jgi:hypothetical protein
VTDETGEVSEAGERTRTRDEALSVLRDALEWFLTPAEWAGVAATLDGLGADEGGGLDLADPVRRKALKDATIQLELAGPLRIEAVDRAAEPVPPSVRERLSVLIGRLSTPEDQGGQPGARQ